MGLAPVMIFLRSLLLPFFGPITIPSITLLLLAIGFTVICVCVPYMLFYFLNRYTDYVALSPLFHASIIITFGAQWLLWGINEVSIIPATILIITSSLIASEPWVRKP